MSVILAKWISRTFVQSIFRKLWQSATPQHIKTVPDISVQRVLENTYVSHLLEKIDGKLL
jgi:hypothetical protein